MISLRFYNKQQLNGKVLNSQIEKKNEICHISYEKLSCDFQDKTLVGFSCIDIPLQYYNINTITLTYYFSFISREIWGIVKIDSDWKKTIRTLDRIHIPKDGNRTHTVIGG